MLWEPCAGAKPRKMTAPHGVLLAYYETGRNEVRVKMQKMPDNLTNKQGVLDTCLEPELEHRGVVGINLVGTCKLSKLRIRL